MLPPPGGNSGTQSNHTHVTHVTGGSGSGGCGGSSGNGGNTGGRDQHDGTPHTQNSKLERPNTLGTNKVSRRVNICYHNEHCKLLPLHFWYFTLVLHLRTFELTAKLYLYLYSLPYTLLNIHHALVPSDIIVYLLP